MNNGLTLGRGLTPFAVVCKGHANAEKLKRDVKKNEMVLVGGMISLSLCGRSHQQQHLHTHGAVHCSREDDGVVNSA
jgi:hypothetical protein